MSKVEYKTYYYPDGLIAITFDQPLDPETFNRSVEAIMKELPKGKNVHFVNGYVEGYIDNET